MSTAVYDFDSSAGEQPSERAMIDGLMSILDRKKAKYPFYDPSGLRRAGERSFLSAEH